MEALEFYLFSVSALSYVPSLGEYSQLGFDVIYRYETCYLSACGEFFAIMNLIISSAPFSLYSLFCVPITHPLYLLKLSHSYWMLSAVLFILFLHSVWRSFVKLCEVHLPADVRSTDELIKGILQV